MINHHHIDQSGSWVGVFLTLIVGYVPDILKHLPLVDIDLGLSIVFRAGSIIMLCITAVYTIKNNRKK